jgi:hypothetical protein
VHNIIRTSKDASKDAQKNQVAQEPPRKKAVVGPLSNFVVASRKVQKEHLARAIWKYIIRSQKPFGLVESQAFQDFIADVAVLCQVKDVPAMVSRHTIKNWTIDAALSARQALKVYLDRKMVHKKFAITVDEKKAIYKGVPMMDIILHCFVEENGVLKIFVCPLDIVKLDGKDTESRVDAIVGVVSEYGLELKNCVLLTADQGDQSVGKKLSEKYSVTYLPCAAHRLSNVVKTAAEKADLYGEVGRLFEQTELVVNAVRSHYQIRDLYEQLRLNPEYFGEDHKPVPMLVKWSKTRFAGALHAGYRFSLNARILEEIARRATSVKRDKKHQSLAKFPLTAEQLRELFPLWEEISRFAGLLDEAIVIFCAEKYPRITQLVSTIFLLDAHLLWHVNDEERRQTFCQEVQTYITELRRDIHARFTSDLDNPIVCAATITDVRFRNFNPARMGKLADNIFSRVVFRSLYDRHCAKLVNGAIRCYYNLFPRELQEEKADKNSRLSKYLLTTEARGTADTDAWLLETSFAIELQFFLDQDLSSFSDKGLPISFRTNASQWLFDLNTFGRVRKLGLVTHFAPASQVSCERLWKKLDRVLDKVRGKMEIKVGAAQVFLFSVWDCGCGSGDVLPGLKAPQFCENAPQMRN